MTQRTPDYFPGRREEEQILFLSGTDLPIDSGSIVYVTSSGFRFNDEGSQIRLRHWMQHFIDDGPAVAFGTNLFKETLPSASPFPTSYVWWDNPAKNRQILRLEVTRSNPGNKPTTENWKLFSEDGTSVIETVTDVISYNGAFETSRTRTTTP